MNNMKKILNFFIVFLFLATAPSNAQFFRDQSDSESSYSSSSSSSYSGESSDDYGGFFRSSNSTDPGGRPGGGEGIGQEAPIRDGIPVIIACCIALALLKIFDVKNKESSQEIYVNNDDE